MSLDLASKAIEIARTQVGVEEVPRGSNRGPAVDEYLRSVGLDSSRASYAWCAAFCSWSIAQAAKALGIKPQFRGSAGALRLLEKNPGLILDTPVPNSIFVMDFGKGKGHTGFVYAIDPDGEKLWTVEGNSDSAGSRTGGSVVLLDTRRVSKCAGFLRIA